MNFYRFYKVIFATVFTMVVVPLAVLACIHIVKLIIEAVS